MFLSSELLAWARVLQRTVENKLQIVDPMQRAAVNAVATFATSYAYSYLMNRPINMSRTAKKALFSEGLIYAYKRYR